MSHIIDDFLLREDGSSIISPSISRTDERRTSYPFKVNPFVEKSFGEFTDRKGGTTQKYLTRDHDATGAGVHPVK
jgi:hypothetical protein